MRIVSLLPSATEIVCAVGARDELVAVSHECDHPADVRELPRVTRARASLPASSAGIDRTIREMLEAALAIYDVRAEDLRALEPDVVVTQDLCEVCAVGIDDVRRALSACGLDGVEVVSLRPTRLVDVWQDVRRVACAVRREDRGMLVADVLEKRVHALAERTSVHLEAPRVLTVEWLDPVMIGGTWMPELVVAAGGLPLVTEPGEPAPTLSLEQLEALDPDVVLVKPCGFDLVRGGKERELLATRLPWRSWRAAREGRVYLAGGNAYFNRSGPRLVDSAEILAACIRPEAFPDLVERHREAYCRVTPELELVAPTVR